MHAFLVIKLGTRATCHTCHENRNILRHQIFSNHGLQKQHLSPILARALSYACPAKTAGGRFCNTALTFLGDVRDTYQSETCASLDHVFTGPPHSSKV